MPAKPLNHPYCEVVTGDRALVGVGLEIPMGGSTATVKRGSEILERREDADAIEPTSGNSWKVTFADGAVWLVTGMKQPCGCGGGA